MRTVTVTDDTGIDPHTLPNRSGEPLRRRPRRVAPHQKLAYCLTNLITARADIPDLAHLLRGLRGHWDTIKQDPTGMPDITVNNDAPTTTAPTHRHHPQHHHHHIPAHRMPQPQTSHYLAHSTSRRVNRDTKPLETAKHQTNGTLM